MEGTYCGKQLASLPKHIVSKLERRTITNMTSINNVHHINLHRLSHEELINAREIAEQHIAASWEDIARLNGELALRGNVQLVIPNLDYLPPAA